MNTIQTRDEQQKKLYCRKITSLFIAIWPYIVVSLTAVWFLAVGYFFCL